MRLVLASVFVMLAGCNSGLDQQSAAKVMSSALTGTASAQTQLKPMNGATNASFDGDIQNPAGSGSAHVTGSTTSTSNGWNVTFDITFSHWTDLATNVTLDGALHETASFTTMSPFVGSVAITGSVTASGAVQSSVDFDVDVSYSPTQYQVAGHVGGASVNASVNL
ncbi:MAG TPA: hypothetical protein VHB97_18805 [Polyangia bacterium]|jgi:hypothetical protein|nr:hypothetical protein [Polyangia bacterium]